MKDRLFHLYLLLLIFIFNELNFKLFLDAKQKQEELLWNLMQF